MTVPRGGHARVRPASSPRCKRRTTHCIDRSWRAPRCLRRSLDVRTICLESTAAADPESVAFMADRRARAKFVTSVCPAWLILGAAGLLKRYKAASHGWETLRAVAIDEGPATALTCPFTLPSMSQAGTASARSGALPATFSTSPTTACCWITPSPSAASTSTTPECSPPNSATAFTSDAEIFCSDQIIC
jgi:hypothetical protein